MGDGQRGHRANTAKGVNRNSATDSLHDGGELDAGHRLSRSSESHSWGTVTRTPIQFEVRGTTLPTPTVQFSSATYSATEGGTATVTVNLSVAPKRQVVIPISAANQNNASASDYSGFPRV